MQWELKPELKSVSKDTFKILLDHPQIVTDIFFEVRFLDRYSQIRKRVNRIYKKYNNYDWIELEKQFLEEWKTPELNLHKYWYELTFLLAG